MEPSPANLQDAQSATLQTGPLRPALRWPQRRARFSAAPWGSDARTDLRRLGLLSQGGVSTQAPGTRAAPPASNVGRKKVKKKVNYP